MNYNEALNYIHGTYRFGSKLGLDNIKYLLNLMNNPHKGLKTIHIAGTNGKGSTSTYLSSILIEEGYKVGLFTSPYLEEFTERIQVNGENIPKEDLARITKFVKEKVDQMLADGRNHPTEFEIVTAIAFKYYSEINTDYVILEVGMGGRLDSTNVIEQPLISIITPIAMDHTDYLGCTLDKIAYEKAGIIKNKSFVVTHPQEILAANVIKEQCDNKGSILFIAPTNNIEISRYDEFGLTFDVNLTGEEYKGLEISMLGKHQVNNAVVALTAIKVLKDHHKIFVSDESIRAGLKKAKWPGRLEVFKRNPMVLIDGAHNTHGAEALRTTIDEVFKDKEIIGLIGILGDKDYKGILNEIIPLCKKVIATRPNNPRALKVDILIKEIEDFNVEVEGYESIEAGFNRAMELGGDSLILCCGSLYLIGEIRTLLKKE